MSHLTWPPVVVSQGLQLHADLVKLVESHTEIDLDRPLGQFLVIRSTGLIETTRDNVAREYARAMCNHRVHRRVTNTFVKGQGCERSQLRNFLATFDEDWADEFDQFLEADDEIRKTHLSLLVGQRKLIAHGAASQARKSQALQWSQTAREVSKWLVNCFDPQRNAL